MWPEKQVLQVKKVNGNEAYSESGEVATPVALQFIAIPLTIIIIKRSVHCMCFNTIATAIQLNGKKEKFNCTALFNLCHFSSFTSILYTFQPNYR